MISKKLHYCWFGGKPLSAEAQCFLSGWKALCPGYEIVRWDERNAPLADNTYAAQALAAGKWAFVSDYVRLRALWEQGGVYLDTDVELLRPLDRFLDAPMFVGFEGRERAATCVIGAEPHHPLIGELLREYESLSFLREDGSFDYTTNVERMTALLLRHGLRPDGSYQRLAEVTVYPCAVFSPKSLEDGKIHCTEETHAIHHFSASWMPLRNRVNTRIAQLLGPRLTQYIKKLLGR